MRHLKLLQEAFSVGGLCNGDGLCCPVPSHLQSQDEMEFTFILHVVFPSEHIFGSSDEVIVFGR